MIRRQAPRVNRTGVSAKPAVPVLLADQMRLGDGELLGLGIAGQVDDLEPVPQGRWNPGRLVRRRDEQHLGQVEGQLDERVAETGVLRRSSTSSRTAAGARPSLSISSSTKTGSFEPTCRSSRRIPARLRVLPCAVVPAQVRLVPQSAAGQLHETAPERLGDTVPQ